MALDLFLVIDGVQGESQDAAFPNGMELLGFKLGGRNIGEKAKRRAQRQKLPGQQETPPPGTHAPAPKKKKMTELFSFSIDKYLDYASPVLLKNYAQTRASTGTEDLKPFRLATLSVRKPPANPGGQPFVFFTLEFEQVYVVKYEVNLDTETNTPTEDIDFCFNTCVMTYTPQKMSGEPDRQLAPMGWDFFINDRKPKQ